MIMVMIDHGNFVGLADVDEMLTNLSSQLKGSEVIRGQKMAIATDEFSLPGFISQVRSYFRRSGTNQCSPCALG